MLLLRVCRFLRGETLDSVSLAADTWKSYLSEIETGTARSISDRVKRRLVKHYGAPSWSVLMTPVDGKRLAASLIAAAAKPTTPTPKKKET